MVSYRINVSRGGNFYFEISRFSKQVRGDLTGFISGLREDYPKEKGFKVTLYSTKSESRKVEL